MNGYKLIQCQYLLPRVASSCDLKRKKKNQKKEGAIKDQPDHLSLYKKIGYAVFPYMGF